ncbi:hypothetical protein CROQUDRAFT_107959 [Cronartium quercuum f. sp. fusiforme G11]|uniref:Uncharacterized protein n=1 Tax=Cronartium quercuum f. sp. fusiforme G11 TaxID=708437 RepID=A0A9P6TB31_9BASI|nr:hypothetical protein CROQUDRAFT_107959 [Cronartium quercuum f. sp. fusiforme G11]
MRPKSEAQLGDLDSRNGEKLALISYLVSEDLVKFRHDDTSIWIRVGPEVFPATSRQNSGRVNWSPHTLNHINSRRIYNPQTNLDRFLKTIKLSQHKSDSMSEPPESSYIKLETQAEYDRFLEKLTAQVRTYTNESCVAHGIRLGSSEAKAAEEVIFDVFLKYTLELMRPNLSIAGVVIPPPPEFIASTTNSNKQTSGSSPTRSNVQNPVEKQTKPIDTALSDRVIRQQFAVYDASVVNLRKRKDLPTHLVQLVKTGVDEQEARLNAQAEQIEQSEAARLEQMQLDSRTRWKVVNDKLINVDQAQEDFTATSSIFSKLLVSLPSVVEKSERAIELQKEFTESFCPTI